MGAGRPPGGVGTALGSAVARNRPGYRPFQVSPPQRVSPRARRHAALSARGAVIACRAGGRPSASAVLRVPGGFVAAVGPSRRISDRAFAPRGLAAPGTKSTTPAGSSPHRQRPQRHHGIAAALDKGTSFDAGGSGTRTRLLERGGLSPDHRLAFSSSLRSGRDAHRTDSSNTPAPIRVPHWRRGNSDRPN